MAYFFLFLSQVDILIMQITILGAILHYDTPRHLLQMHTIALL